MGLDDITGGFPGLVPDDLQEALLVARAGKRPQDRVPDLRQFLGHRRRWVSADLLCRLWPEGRWTVAEARSVADTFEPDQLRSDPVYSWIAQAVLEPPADEGYLVPYAELGKILAACTVDRALPEPARRRLDSFRSTEQLIEQARDSEGKAQAQLVRRLAGSDASLDGPAQDLSRQALVALLDQLAGSRYLPTAVEAYPAAVISAFLRSAPPAPGRHPAGRHGRRPAVPQPGVPAAEGRPEAGPRAGPDAGRGAEAVAADGPERDGGDAPASQCRSSRSVRRLAPEAPGYAAAQVVAATGDGSSRRRPVTRPPYPPGRVRHSGRRLRCSCT